MRLGWDAALWEDGGVPEALDCRWGELSAEQQALAAALGYEQEAWDKEHVGHDQAVAAPPPPPLPPPAPPPSPRGVLNLAPRYCRLGLPLSVSLSPPTTGQPGSLPTLPRRGRRSGLATACRVCSAMRAGRGVK